ncbi:MULTISPECIES: hypothetical protein [Streptomyces]|uniref:Uncharacterized protein n=1 Tax=Streptomyces qinglanensis TaxID=943816 RepID=A0A1E7K1H3_9ACTN|nr:hypothetical protein [Streptomyces qinglanensis]OEU97793.1 hypothetical protein AN217_07930 [Streptomyces qinglanensis]OEV22961.1 hypothetical protein AN220_26925 [Streptomyces nanshensis]
MPDDVGGGPFPDGEEPEYRDRGAADDEFASVVLDEDFVRAAEVHEPSAAERILASDRSRAESEPFRGVEDGFGHPRGEGEIPHEEFAEADDPFDGDFDDDPDDDEGRFDRSEYRVEYERAEGGPPEPEPGHEHGSDFGYRAHRRPVPYQGPRPYRGHREWQRPVAWVLAVVMGIGMVALAFSAVYRGTSDQRQDPTPPPATTGVDRDGPGAVSPVPAVEPPGG